MALADLSLFRAWTALVVVALAAVGAALFWRQGAGERERFSSLSLPGPATLAAPSASGRKGRGGTREALVAGAILLVGSAMIAPGSESIAGPRDQAGYVATGFAIARWGSTTIADPALRRLSGAMDPTDINAWLYENAVNHARIRFPTQLFVQDVAAGTVEGAFLPVLPVWIALTAALSARDSAPSTQDSTLRTQHSQLEPALHVAGAFGVLALAFAMLASAAAGQTDRGSPLWPLVGAFLAVSFPQVWWAREPMAESALGAFTWIAAWAGVRWLAGGGWRFAVLAALSASTAQLTRADGLLLAAAVGLLVLGYREQGRSRALLVLVLGFGAAALHWRTVASIYMSTTFGAFTFSRAALGLLIVGAVCLTVVAASTLRRSTWWADRSSSLAQYVTWGRRGVVLLVVGLGAAGAASGIVPGVEREAALGAASPLAWLPGYVPWPWLILAAIGAAGLGWAGAPRGLVPLIAVAGLPALLYVPDPLVTGDHPWMVRRLVPAVIPLIAVLAAIGAVGLWQLARSWRNRWAHQVGPVIAAALVGLGFAMSIARDVDLLGPRHGSGSIAGLTELAAYLPSNAVVVFPAGPAGAHLAMPLGWIFGVDAFAVPSSLLTPPMASTLARLEASGRAVYWAAEAGKPLVWPPGVTATPGRVSRVRYASADHGPVPPPLQLTAVEDTVTLHRLTFRGSDRRSKRSS